MSKIMVPRKVAEFDKDFNAISLDLVKKIQRQRNPETNIISDTADFFMKWSFECKCQLLGIYNFVCTIVDGRWHHHSAQTSCPLSDAFQARVHPCTREFHGNCGVLFQTGTFSMHYGIRLYLPLTFQRDVQVCHQYPLSCFSVPSPFRTVKYPIWFPNVHNMVSIECHI